MVVYSNRIVWKEINFIENWDGSSCIKIHIKMSDMLERFLESARGFYPPQSMMGSQDYTTGIGVHQLDYGNPYMAPQMWGKRSCSSFQLSLVAKKYASCYLCAVFLYPMYVCNGEIYVCNREIFLGSTCNST